MIELKASQEVARPIDEVWDYISDFDNWPAWDPGLFEVRWERPLKLGTRVEMHDASPVLRAVSRIVPPVFTVTDYEDGRRLRVSISRGASAINTVYSLEALGPGTTRITRSFSFDARGVWRLLELLMRRRAIRGVHDELDNLKQILDQGGDSRSS